MPHQRTYRKDYNIYMGYILFNILIITLMIFLGLLVISCAIRIIKTSKNLDRHIQVLSTFFAIFSSVFVWVAIIDISYFIIKQLNIYIAG